MNGDGKLDLVVSNQTSNNVCVLLQDPTTPGKFLSPTYYSCGSNTNIGQVVDVNGDGLPDIVIPTSGGQVLVFLNDSAHPGQFLTPASYAAGAGSHQVAVLDLNGDGLPDIAVADSGSNTVSILLQDPSNRGTFLPATSFTANSGGNAYYLDAGDLNGDGLPDLVVGFIGAGTNAVSVLLNDPQHPGSFLAPTVYAIQSECLAITVADLDRDGKKDIVACNRWTNFVSIFRGHGDGTFAARADYATGTNPSWARAVDVNGDGKLDLVIANWGYPENDIEFLIQDPQTPCSFVAGKGYHTGTQPSVVDVADLNGDGVLDYVTTNWGSGDITVLFGISGPPHTTSFGAPQSIATGSGTRWVGVADLNRDGKPDLVVTNAHSNTISVLLQDPNNPGSFPTKVDYATPGNPCLAAIADLNGDGLPDVVTANQAGGNVSVFLQDPAHPGTFLARTDYAVGPNCCHVVIADFNHDGRPDLAVAVADANAVAILLQDPANPGKFLAPTTFAVASTPQSLAAGDLNGDGWPDLIVGCTGADVVSVLLADRAHPGRFLAASSVTVGSYPLFVTLADMNRDGKLDIVCANRFGNSVSILHGVGDGTFGPRVDVPCGTEPWSLAVADVNGDGRPDIAVVNYSSNDLVLLMQDANGNFVAGPSTSLASGGTNASSVALASLTNGSKLDAVVTYFVPGNAAILRGQ